MISTSMQHDESGSKRFWMFDPECNGMEFFRTKEERDAAAELSIQGYLDGGTEWVEVPRVVCGVVTHVTIESDREERPEVDEDGESEGGDYWDADCQFKCNYKLTPLDPV